MRLSKVWDGSHDHRFKQGKALHPARTHGHEEGGQRADPFGERKDGAGSLQWKWRTKGSISILQPERETVEGGMVGRDRVLDEPSNQRFETAGEGSVSLAVYGGGSPGDNGRRNPDAVAGDRFFQST
ncbi:hypothetical protein FACS1894109_20370 [Spirochaetia bacterium]|nr:hypothetical protein FACS1894109_20370 [Spirochaetia bacterium]